MTDIKASASDKADNDLEPSMEDLGERKIAEDLGIEYTNAVAEYASRLITVAQSEALRRAAHFIRDGEQFYTDRAEYTLEQLQEVQAKNRTAQRTEKSISAEINLSYHHQAYHDQQGALKHARERIEGYAQHGDLPNTSRVRLTLRKSCVITADRGGICEIAACNKGPVLQLGNLQSFTCSEMAERMEVDPKDLAAFLFGENA